jgi:hypothetical protein
MSSPNSSEPDDTRALCTNVVLCRPPLTQTTTTLSLFTFSFRMDSIFQLLVSACLLPHRGVHVHLQRVGSASIALFHATLLFFANVAGVVERVHVPFASASSSFSCVAFFGCLRAPLPIGTVTHAFKQCTQCNTPLTRITHNVCIVECHYTGRVLEMKATQTHRDPLITRNNHAYQKRHSHTHTHTYTLTHSPPQCRAALP